MPVIRRDVRYAGVPYPVEDRVSPTIGWQWRAEAKGGPSFAVMSRTILGSFKVLERFPLTEDGWAEAWGALVKLNPRGAKKVLATLAARAAEELASGPSPALAELDGRSLACLREVAFLGGYAPNAAIAAGSLCDVRFLEDRLIVVPCRQAEVLAEVLYSQVEDVEIGGPGLVKSGGGFVGGGFGAAGAAEGMAIATVLNGLTTRTSIKTVVRVQGAGCELFLLYTKATPEQLRIQLSRPLGAIRAARSAAAHENLGSVRSTSLVDELAKLASMLESGLLTRDEFDRLKARLLADS